jgi:hypothetical protein
MLWIRLNCRGRLIPAFDTTAVSLFQLSDGLLYQLFAAGAPWKWKSHIFCLKPLKLVYCNLLEEVLLNFQKIPSSQHFSDIYRLSYKTSNYKTPNYKHRISKHRISKCRIAKRRITKRRILQNVESYKTSKYKTSNLTERRNTKRWLYKTSKKWQDWMVNMFWNHLFISTLRLKLNFTVHEYYLHCGPLPRIPNLTLT